MYNSLLNLKFSSQTKVIAFADDLIVLTRGTSTIEAENYANQDLKKIERWATDNKMEFNDKKSRVLFISRKRNDEKNVSIYLNYKKLDQTNELKYLGIYLDSKFNFNAHIDYTTDKLIKLINTLARTAKLQWGLGHKALKIIYEGAIVPVLTYGAPVWVDAIKKSRNLAKYKRIQRLINIRYLLRNSWRTTYRNTHRTKGTNLREHKNKHFRLLRTTRSQVLVIPCVRACVFLFLFLFFLLL
jgi:hypothetical protein